MSGIISVSAGVGKNDNFFLVFSNESSQRGSTDAGLAPPGRAGKTGDSIRAGIFAFHSFLNGMGAGGLCVSFITSVIVFFSSYNCSNHGDPLLFFVFTDGEEAKSNTTTCTNTVEIYKKKLRMEPHILKRGFGSGSPYKASL